MEICLWSKIVAFESLSASETGMSVLELPRCQVVTGLARGLGQAVRVEHCWVEEEWQWWLLGPASRLKEFQVGPESLEVLVAPG